MAEPQQRIVTNSSTGAAAGEVDAPDDLAVEWIPAPYARFGPGAADFGNHHLKPDASTPRLRYVVIHDSEVDYDETLRLVQDVTYLSWHYTLRSRDGHVAQHVRASEAMCRQAGNWYINQHSVGLEHEGWMTSGAQWFTEAMYRSSARLVRHLCLRHGIPIDRAHVIGHDMVPAPDPGAVARMHVDPGPFWDWEHYFDLLGVPLSTGTLAGFREQGRREQVVRILPRFATNRPQLTGCDQAGQPCAAQPANFLWVRQAPDHAAPLVRDVGRRPGGEPATTDAADVGARATAGQDYVSIERRGDWLAIWFLGQLGWVHDPDDQPRTRVVADARIVRPRSDRPVPTFGTCFPEASAYPAASPHLDEADAEPVVAMPYEIAPGQACVVTDEAPVTDYYRARTFGWDTPGDHVDVVGGTRYLQVSYGPRLAFVRADQVLVERLTAGGNALQGT